MYTLDIDKTRNLPQCRKYYQIGDSYCAMGKLFKGLGLEIPVCNDGFHIAATETSDFIVEIGHRVNNMNWASEVMDINDDMSMDLMVAHAKAFDLATDYVLKSGVVSLRTREYALS